MEKQKDSEAMDETPQINKQTRWKGGMLMWEGDETPEEIAYYYDIDTYPCGCCMCCGCNCYDFYDEDDEDDDEDFEADYEVDEDSEDLDDELDEQDEGDDV